MKRKQTWLLAGNPNTGKTSLFNKWTGLRKKTGNYPGITVRKQTGNLPPVGRLQITLWDLPGAYSIHPHSPDEQVVLETLLGRNGPFDGVVVVADVQHLRKNLLLLSEIMDLELPVVLVINMCDEAARKGIRIDTQVIEKEWGIPVLSASAKNHTCDQTANPQTLVDAMQRARQMKARRFFPHYKLETANFRQFIQAHPGINTYRLWLLYTEQKALRGKASGPEKDIPPVESEYNAVKHRLHREVVLRYRDIGRLLRKAHVRQPEMTGSLTEKIDRILLHPVLGILIFLLVMAGVFQAVFTWSAAPMEWIDRQGLHLAMWLRNSLPPGPLTGLLADGLVPGLTGVLMFVPQITLLFLFIGLLEETGYMSRIVFLTDRLLRPFGLSGKAVVPLLSGTACAVPAVLAARTVENAAQRLITMLVTPFVTCSARLPVYAVLIGLVIPQRSWLGGLINLQGLVLMGLYLLGFGMALLSAWILKHFIRPGYPALLIMEMPHYKPPIWRNLFHTLWDNVKAFMLGAGKIIVAFSIILWFLGTHGGERFRQAARQGDPALQLEHSYLGRMGKAIEPAIRPLGYDWKIGIALLSSFAAREVFVSTLSTIYSVQGDGRQSLMEKMRNETDLRTGRHVFSLATGLSLLIFYALAMQCFSTLAVLRQETGSWKWPALVFGYMTGLAYVLSLAVYQFLS